MLRCGLLGEKLGHSYSPEIHALLGDYEYELYEKTPGEAEVFLRHGEFDGLNVTIPYKKTAAALCAQLSPVARKLGSVNTIAVRKGEDGTRALYGDNTDYAGFAALVRKSRVRVEGCKCLVLGSGGASVTVQAVLKNLGAGEVVVISRSGADNYGNLERHADADVLVNTTPVGMYPNNGQAPLDLRAFRNLKAVYDLIYNPARTALVLQAESLGIPAFGGLLMLVAQAEAASRVFTADDPAHPDEDPLRSAAKIQAICDYLSGAQQNVALIGMPGCGKSAVAKALEELTGRKVFDADEEIERRTGKLIPEIFAEGGEDGFR
ncbi:MAG: shikimate kinase, partial [Firmicutes bacterium]|nr:shikimate kinase [Bacillota bacterium]